MHPTRRVLRKVMHASAEHEAHLCASLTVREREQLIDLLSRLAAEHGLTTGVHPGVAEGEGGAEASKPGSRSQSI